MRHILSHSSGLRSNDEEEFYHGIPEDNFFKTNLIAVTLRYLLNKASWLSEVTGNITYYRNIGTALDASNSTEWLYIPHYSISVYPSAMLRMSARSLSIYLRSFLNNFSPDLLQNLSSINEILHISRPEGSKDEPNVQYGLIWNWHYQNNRHLVGHRGWMPGVAHTMMANENRSLAVILLSNGDITWGDDLAKQVSSTLIDIMGQLFDCFEK
ncbi:unnamed protein product [Rotaria sp. Silwood1]|nr:unnamed protein product [Rotaria sp. Silwood1]